MAGDGAVEGVADCCAEMDALAMQRRSARQRWPMLKDKPRGEGERREDGDGIIEVWVRLGT